MTMPNYDKLKARAAGSRLSTGWRPKEGDNRIRVLPPHSKYVKDISLMEDVAVGFKLHYFRIEGRPTEVSRCLEELKQRCPACEAWRTHRKSEDAGLKQLAGQIAPADNYLMNILDLNNLQAGVQHWGANYTCWSKILEIVANAQWGNVLGVSDGTNFVITMTPGSKSRTGFNSYSLLPERQPSSIVETLAALPDWQQKVDGLADQISAAMEASEIQALVEEMGFPPPVKRAGAAGGPPAPRPAGAVPTPTAPTPVASAAIPGPVPAPSPVGVAPAAPSTVVTGFTPAATADAEAVGAYVPHYDPGPQYTPKLPDGVRPAQVPRCYSDFQPGIHRCEPCPVKTPCQLKALNIG